MNQRKHPGNSNKKPVRIIVGNAPENQFRRNNLLINAERGLGKAIQVGKHLSYVIGNDNEGYIEYFILNATLSNDGK